MIKRLLLALTLIASPTIIKACEGPIHVDAPVSRECGMVRFQHEHLLSALYLSVDVSELPRIIMQKLCLEYIAWLDDVTDHIVTKEDSIYVARISQMFAEVAISYRYGN